MTNLLKSGDGGRGMVGFTFNGEEMQAHEGASVAAALISNGGRTTRTTRINQQPRGVFCGIGICFDCLVDIDGTPNQRACLVEVSQGMKVELQVGVGDYAEQIEGEIQS